MSKTKNPRKASGFSSRNLVIGGVFALMLAIVFGNLLISRPSGSKGDPSDATAVAKGQLVYAQYCASCHGANLEGQPDWQQQRPDGTWPAPPHDISGHTWHHNDESLFTTVKFGSQATSPAGYKVSMPGYASTLSDDEIWAVLAFIKSTWPAEYLEIQQSGHQ